MEIKFEINKELECKNWKVITIYLIIIIIIIIIIIEIILKMIVMLMNKDKNE